jgi:hypothetical protein
MQFPDPDPELELGKRLIEPSLSQGFQARLELELGSIIFLLK